MRKHARSKNVMVREDFTLTSCVFLQKEYE